MKKIYLTPKVNVSKVQVSTCLMSASNTVNIGFGPTSDGDLTPEGKKRGGWEDFDSEW